MGDIKRVGVMMELDKPFKRHVSVYAGVLDYASKHPDWKLVVDEWAGHSLPTSPGEPIPYDGIIGRISKIAADRARRLNVPVANVWLSTPATGLPGVFPDYVAAGSLVAEHLLSRGFRHLAALLETHDKSTVLQAAAMEKTVRDSGSASWLGAKALGHSATHGQWKRAIKTIETWMDSWKLPLGILVREPTLARVIIERAQERGWHVPQQIAIVLSSNDELHCDRPEPGLTAVEQPDERCGYEAAQMLDDLIERRRQGMDPFADPQVLTLPPVGIASRHSTDFFAVPDPLVGQALQYIAANLHRPLRVPAVAKHLGVARRTLDAWFQQSLGSTAATEIARLRIERVKRELKAGEESVEVIAKRTGFASVRTLNDQFRRMVGMSPTEYRA